MRYFLNSVAVAAALVVTLPTLAHAQSNCAARDKVISKLEAGYGETFAGGGLQNSQRIYEVWFSAEKGTWTILMTRADGSTCIMASGTHWREGLPGQEPVKGTPS